MTKACPKLHEMVKRTDKANTVYVSNTETEILLFTDNKCTSRLDLLFNISSCMMAVSGCSWN